MFEFLKSKKRKEQERLEKEALEARKERLAQQPYKRNPPPTTSQQIDGNDYSAAYWLSQTTNSAPSNGVSDKFTGGGGSFSGAGASSSWDSSSSCSRSSGDSYSSSDSSSSSSGDSSSSCSSD